MKVMVTGGAGFIGRHAVIALREMHHDVVIGSRHPGQVAARIGSASAACECRQVRFERLAQPSGWYGLLDGVDAVVNCVGILRQRGAETYHAVHVAAPLALAQACRERGIRLVHVSALGLQHAHRSGFLRSKRRAEELLATSGADYCLVRPSLLDGQGGFGARWIRWLSRLPVHLLAKGAVGRIAALDAHDLGEALAKLVAIRIPPDASSAQREFELGGLASRDLADYMQSLRRDAGAEAAICLRVPGWLARLGSHACDIVHFSPFSFGHWELLQHDNVPLPNRLPELLCRPPRGVGSAPAAAALSLGSWAGPHAAVSSNERSAT